MNDTLRAGAMAVGVAACLMALASTAQTPDGYIHASFGGPLDVFSTSTPADVLAIGDGTNDANEIASLLKGPVGPAAREGAANSPYGVAYQAGQGVSAPSPDTEAIDVTDPKIQMPPVTAAPTIKDSAILPSKQVIDSQGRIDCSGAVSCRTDPTTKITTVTYPDGVVAIVQKINDLTVVAYKTITEALPTEISSLLPPAPTTGPPPLLAAVAPAMAPAPTPASQVAAPEPVVTPPEPETPSAPIDPGPPAPSIDLDDDGPRIDVTKPPMDFSPGQDDAGTDKPAPQVPDLGKVKDTIGGIVDDVKDAVGKALNPGASSKPGSSDGPSNDSPQGPQNSGPKKSETSEKKADGDNSDG